MAGLIVIAFMAGVVAVAAAVRWLGDRRDYRQLVRDYETSLILRRNGRLSVPPGMKVDFFPDHFAGELAEFRARYPSVKAYEKHQNAPPLVRTVRRDSIAILATIGCVLAVTFNIWIAFRVVDGWWGLIAATVSAVLFPLTTLLLPVVMFFIPSDAAGPLAMWPGLFVVGLLTKHSIFGRRT